MDRWLHPRDSIHPWRWRALTLWIIIFTALTFLALRNLDNTTAKIAQLEQTNCGLKVFLLTARDARIRQANNSSGRAKDANLRAARGYQDLAERFTAVGNCRIPKDLLRNG